MREVLSTQRYIMVCCCIFSTNFRRFNNIFVIVDGGHRAVIFDRFQGIKQLVVGEGTHFYIPWIQRPIIFDIRSQPRNIPVITGSKDMQNVNITLRILFRPVPDQLPKIYTILGVDYDDRVLPSITTEVLKAVVAQFDAGELITQREVILIIFITSCEGRATIKRKWSLLCVRSLVRTYFSLFSLPNIEKMILILSIYRNLISRKFA